jgi:hypothetical protein
MKTILFLLAATVLASTAWAEPMFLAKQYTRCTPCHYSPTGGGLLTPYGRLLSHRELSTTGGTATAPAAGAEDDPRGEQAFLYGALGSALGPVHLGLEMRPSHRLRVPRPARRGSTPGTRAPCGGSPSPPPPIPPSSTRVRFPGFC